MSIPLTAFMNCVDFGLRCSLAIRQSLPCVGACWQSFLFFACVCACQLFCTMRQLQVSAAYSTHFRPCFSFAFACHTLSFTQAWNLIPLCHLHKLVKSFLQVSVTCSRKLLLFQTLLRTHYRGMWVILYYCCERSQWVINKSPKWNHPWNKLSPDWVKIKLFFFLNPNVCSDIQASVHMEQY